MFYIDILKNEWFMGYRPLKYDVVIGRVDVIMVYPIHNNIAGVESIICTAVTALVI